MQIKKQVEFPLLKRYKRYFDINDKTIFAYDNNIYCNEELSHDLIVHEMTHLIQQNDMGVDEWVNKYLEDKEFRLKQEVEAYRQQLDTFKDRNDKARCRVESATNLSSSLYGGIISYEQALKILK